MPVGEDIPPSCDTARRHSHIALAKGARSMTIPQAAYKTPHRILAAIRMSLIASVVAAALNLLPAQGMPSMTKKDTVRGMSQERHMRDLMGAPLPFGIMIGEAEQWMVGYQGMYESLGGLRDGTTDISNADELTRYQTAPTGMTMKMHMGMLMYAPSAKSTLMAMLSHTSMSMGELHRDGTSSTEHSSGIGDLELRGLYSLYAAPSLRHRVLVTFGVGIPTGSINQRDAEGARLEYPMQPGSGTFSLLPGLMYLGQIMPWSWGAEALSTARLGRNQHDYRMGNRYDTRVWVARRLTTLVSVSGSAVGESLGNIRGSDVSLDPLDEPTKDPSRQGGTRVDALLGIIIHPAQGIFKGQQFLVEGDAPFIQSLDGPQLKRRYMVHAALQWAF